MASALDGLRVVDVSDGVAGGYCTRLLAGLGARVLKAERPGVGDSLRRAGPFAGDVPHIETSIPHLHLNAGKQSVSLDVTSRSGAVLLLRLLDDADVLVVDGAPEQPALALSAITRRYPRLVVVTLTPSGAGGPEAAWRATEIVEMALSGYLRMTGDPDRPPVKPYDSQAMYQGGVHAALGVMAALAARDRHDAGGQHVDVAVTEAAAFLDGAALQRHHFFGREPLRNGARTVGMAPNFLYPSTIRPCLDGWVHVHGHNRFPDLLGALMQEPRLSEPDLLATPVGHADEIDAIVDRWLATRDRWTAVAEAQELRIPFAEVLDPREVVEDRLGQLAARACFAHVEHPVAGNITQPGPPVRMPATPWETRRAPLLGEHNVEIYCERLGLSARDLATLAAAGVV